MVNDPELNGKYLGTITKDFVKVADFLKEASYQVRSRNISQHPIFVMSRQSIALGQLLLGVGERENEWNYNFSLAEEFIQRKLIEEDAVEEFNRIYGNPDEFCCIFVTEGEFTNFIFLPYPDENDSVIGH